MLISNLGGSSTSLQTALASEVLRDESNSFDLHLCAVLMTRSLINNILKDNALVVEPATLFIETSLQPVKEWRTASIGHELVLSTRETHDVLTSQLFLEQRSQCLLLDFGGLEFVSYQERLGIPLVRGIAQALGIVCRAKEVLTFGRCPCGELGLLRAVGHEELVVWAADDDDSSGDARVVEDALPC